MQAIEPPKSLLPARRRRRYKSSIIPAVSIIRSLIREVCAALSGIFVLKLNFVHTTKTSLNPTKILLVNCQEEPRRQQQRARITELPSDHELSDLDFLQEQSETASPPRSCEQLSQDSQAGSVLEDIVNRMTVEKKYVVDLISDSLKSLSERATPILSKAGLFTFAFYILWHQSITQLIIYPIFRLLFGTLYPAYASYKAVKTKNVREYVKWMMYWIVFALFTCAETFTDVFLSWFPFYYEIKIILVIWLLSPATKGSSILYRKFVHPMLSSREQEIDEYISKAKEQSYRQVLDLGSKGVNALMQTAIKGGGGLVNQIRKSYSLSDLSEQRHDREYDGNEETDSLVETRVIRRRHSPRRHSPRRHTTTSAIYFSEIDVRHDALSNIQSVDDISSGYSSGEILHGQPAKIQAREALVRTGSIGSTKLKPTRVTRSTVPKKSTDDLEYNLEYATDTKENVIYLNDKAQFLYELETIQTAKMSESTSSEEEFRDCIEHDGNVDFSNPLNFSRTLDAQSKDVMHENLETSIQPFKSISRKDDQIENDILLIENKEQIRENVLGGNAKDSNNLIEVKDEISLIEENDAQRNEGIEKTIPIELKEVKKDSRGGKYNKPTAPPPPPSKKTEFDLSAIKATLVLKPGVVKSIAAESSKNEVFCHSPKLKRKSLNVSPAASPTATRKLSRSPNRSKSKLDASLSRLMNLPKKMGLWHKDDSAVDQKKRSSWYDIVEPTRQPKELSKSDDDLSKMHAREKLMKRIKSFKEEKKDNKQLKLESQV